MNMTRADLDAAVGQGVLTHDQAGALWRMLEERYATRSRFDLVHVAYYTGALIVISAMTWFMTLAWDEFGGGALLGISLIYALCFALLGRLLWSKPMYKTAGGLLITVAVCMTPLAIYGFEKWIGIWPQGDPGSYRGFYEWVKGSWLFMELGTVIAAAVALKYIRFPFLTAPIAFALWYLSMDLTPLLFGQDEFTWNQRLWVSLCFGLAMLLVSFLVDHRTKEDYAFWGYLFGMFAFWGGLSLMEDQGELGRLIYCLINVGLMFVSVFLGRRVFMIFGGLGVFWYLGYLAYEVFENSLLFPVALTALGLSVIGVGLLYQRYRPQIERAVLDILPPAIKRLRPVHRLG
jgi:hypothetical protein